MSVIICVLSLVYHQQLLQRRQYDPYMVRFDICSIVSIRSNELKTEFVASSIQKDFIKFVGCSSHDWNLKVKDSHNQ